MASARTLLLRSPRGLDVRALRVSLAMPYRQAEPRESSVEVTLSAYALAQH
jgi:hypothetical protein